MTLEPSGAAPDAERRETPTQRSDVDGLLVDPSVDGAVDGAVEPPEPPDPPVPPRFGQSPFAWPWRGPGLPDAAGAAPLPVPLDPCGVVAALGAGVADGSAAKTTAAPPTPSSPMASSVVARSRFGPPRIGAGDEADTAAGGGDAGAGAGSPADRTP